MRTMTLTAAPTRRSATLSLIWAILAGELALGLGLLGGHFVPEVALRGLRLFLRF
jgi:hypothetical protein